MKVTWLGHSTVLLEVGGLRLLTDPVLGRRVFLLRRLAPPVAADAVDGVDVVLISHAHRDHLDQRSLKRVGAVSHVLAPPVAAKSLSRHGVTGTHEVTAGSTVTVHGVTFEAVHARHDGRRGRRGPEAEAVGFVVRGGVSAYFAGDTDVYPQMAELKGSLDLALLPVWGWGPTVGAGHMNPQSAAQALALISPRVVVPIHWGTLAPPWLRPSRTTLHEPAKAFAEAAASLAPEVDVRVLEPGDSTTVG